MVSPRSPGTRVSADGTNPDWVAWRAPFAWNGPAPGAPAMDFIFTVCDSAAGEACPFWPGKPFSAYWGIADPAAVEGTDLEKQRAFNEAFRFLKNRISAFVQLPFKNLEALATERKLKEIGQLPGATLATA